MGTQKFSIIDHYSLKILLEQKVLNPPQQHWYSKLLGFSFSVEYRLGHWNIVADALFMQDVDASVPQISIFDEI